MEKNIIPQEGVYNYSHLKEGIIVRKLNRDLVGLVTATSGGYTIRCIDGSMIGLEPDINNLMLRFTHYRFYLL